MGTSSRLNASQRFINEFGDDIIKVAAPKIAEMSYLEESDADQTVGLYHVMTTPADGEIHFSLRGYENLYDPEFTDDEDLIYKLVNITQLDYDEIVKRCKKAGLLSDDEGEEEDNKGD